jgi:hypothetical protein
MAWDVAIYGELTFPEGKLPQWLATTIDPARYDDWQEDFAAVMRKDRAVVVEHAIAELAHLEQGFVEVVRDEGLGRVRIRAHLVEDDYHDLRRELASIWRVAGPLGATGSLTFVGFMTIDFGFRFHVGPEGTRFEIMSEAARREADDSAEIAEIQAALEKQVGAWKIANETKKTETKERAKRKAKKQRKAAAKKKKKKPAAKKKKKKR